MLYLRHVWGAFRGEDLDVPTEVLVVGGIHQVGSLTIHGGCESLDFLVLDFPEADERRFIQSGRIDDIRSVDG